MITIVLADDHAIVRQGLRALLAAEPDCSVVGEASDGLAAVGLVEQLRPAVLVVDLMMPGLGGIEVTWQVRALPSPPQVVVLSMHADEVYVLEALRKGAAAYVLKENDAAQLLTAVRAAAAGQRYLSPPLSERAIDRYVRLADTSPLDDLDLLTAREREILGLVAAGSTSKEIATRLGISVRTVETHRSNLMQKLDLHSQAEVVRFASQRGLLPSPTPAPE